MKNIFSLLLLLLSCTFALAADPQPVVSVVKEVTIFQNGAQVTRTGTHRVSAGRSELVFKDLSTHILEKSIQLKAEGEITIMSVRFQMNYLEAAGKQGEIKSLETEYEALADRIARLNNDLTGFGVDGVEGRIGILNGYTDGPSFQIRQCCLFCRFSSGFSSGFFGEIGRAHV